MQKQLFQRNHSIHSEIECKPRNPQGFTALWVPLPRKGIVKTPLEKHLEFHCEQLEFKIEQLELVIVMNEQTIADYKKVTRDQQQTICELKDEIMATEVARYEYKS